MALQCFQIAFGQDVKLDRYTIGIIIVEVATYLLINLKAIPAICSVILYALLFAYCYFEFRKTLSKTIMAFVVGFVMIGCIESIVALITNFFRDGSNSITILLASSFLALVMAYAVRRCIKFMKRKDGKKYSFHRSIVVLSLGSAIFVLLLDYYFIQKMVNIYVVVVLFVLVLMLFYLHNLELAKKEIARKNYELELQKVYGNVYSDLLMDVRCRQHDFKNQLGVIYSMHLVATSLDELIAMQKEYCDYICYETKFDSILTSCNNSILAGYLYHRCLECEKREILVDYNICIDQAISRCGLHVLIEIFGILLDNACENFEQQISSRRIKIEFLELQEDIIICISNPSKYISYSEIEKMFCRGFSSKGKNRGIGLPRVRELTEKYDAILKVSNVTYEEDNWIEFLVEIKK